MNYQQYQKADMLNGSGVRCTVFVSGCSFACPGCFNKVAWDPKYGSPFDNDIQNQILKDLDSNYISGLTWLGGDPLHKKNYKSVIEFSKKIKQHFENKKDIWLYTGYTLEEIEADPDRKDILKYIDVLVDGKFEIDKKAKIPFRGSTNQRIIQIKNY